MKKVFSIVAMVALVATFTSCKKDYTCECVTTVNGAEMGRASATKNLSKSDAEEWCSGSSQSSSVGGSTAETKCTLK
jgi:hypothetical protein